MKLRSRALGICSIVIFCLALRAQNAPSPDAVPLAATSQDTIAPLPTPPSVIDATSDPDAPIHYGLTFADFVQVNEVMRKSAQDDPTIQDLSRQIQALIAQREALVIEAACRKHPEAAAKIRTMQQNLIELRRKKAEQDQQTQALGDSQSTPANG